MKKSNKYPIVIALIVFFALFAGNYFQYQLSPLASRLMSEMKLTVNQFSGCFSAPMIPSIFLGIIAGILSDRFGAKKTASVAMLIAACALCARIFADDYTTLFLSMVFAGIGTTFLNIVSPKVLGGWFAPDKLSTVLGMCISGSTLGMTIATATTAAFTSIRTAFIVAAVLMIISTVLWIFFMKDGESASQKKISSASEPKGSFKNVLKSKNVWLIGLCLLCVLGCNVALSSMLPTALSSRGISESASGLISSALTFGSLFGAFFGPMIISHLRSTKYALLILTACLAVTSGISWCLPVPAVVISLLIAGFAMGTIIPTLMSFPMLLPEIGPDLAARAGGVVSTLELLGAVIIPSYIITPIAGTNFTLYFILTGVVVIIMFLIEILLPERTKRTSPLQTP